VISLAGKREIAIRPGTPRNLEITPQPPCTAASVLKLAEQLNLVRLVPASHHDQKPLAARCQHPFARARPSG
jgi:hypothetical protein